MKADSVSSLISLSIRVAKLGLSEEALQAWDLEPNHYIVLLIRYSNGYKTFETIINEPAKSCDVEFRIGVSNRYKPTISEAIAAFTDITKDSHQTSSHGLDEANTCEESSTSEAGFGNLFISSSLNDYFNAQFVSLLKIRNMVGIGWDGAKRYFADKQGKIAPENPELDGEYYQEDTSSKENILPDIVMADHLTDIQVKETSFPLLAAQFAVRYLTRCTEFCLVCHDKINDEFGALKPYVCDKPLCLYQYMSLGFGPSVEHEILTQPYVVDLLASFAYSSAFVSQLLQLAVDTKSQTKRPH
jgi:ubiquitin-conjugating enzyme E2 Q